MAYIIRDDTKKTGVKRYKEEFLQYGFVIDDSNREVPICLSCKKKFTNSFMRSSKMKRHLKTVHPNLEKKDINFWKHKFMNPSEGTLKWKVLKKTEKDEDFFSELSDFIAFTTAKKGYSYNIAENLVLPVIEKLLSHYKIDRTPMVRMLNISRNSIKSSIDKISEKIEESLIQNLKTENFSLQLDESTYGSKSILLTYVRYFDKKESKIQEDLMFIKSMEKGTKGVEIMDAVDSYILEKKIPYKNIISVATDGAPAMVGKKNGFLAYFKEKNNKIFTIHCTLHRQQLIAKKLPENLDLALNTVMKIINKIKKSPLSERKFSDLCKFNNEEYDCLLFYTKIRWLSLGNALKRILILRKSLLEFLTDLNEIELKKDFEKKIIYIIYLKEITSVFNDVNLNLQGNYITIIDTKKEIQTFFEKIINRRKSLETNGIISEKSFFPETKKEIELIHAPINEINTTIIQHLKDVEEDMLDRYKDLWDFSYPLFILNPFKGFDSSEKFPNQIIDELTEIRNDPTAKLLYDTEKLLDFWSSNYITDNYFELFNIVKNFLLIFPNSYRVECAFSDLSHLYSLSRNKLQIEKRGDLRIKVNKKDFELIKKYL